MTNYQGRILLIKKYNFIFSRAALPALTLSRVKVIEISMTNQERNSEAKASFFQKSAEVHNNKYSYKEANYINWNTKVAILCPLHGRFNQTPLNHKRGQGCPICAQGTRKLKRTKSAHSFSEESNKIHSGKYDYSKVIYSGAHSKVEISCPVHGSFWQSPTNHTHQKNGCPKCPAFTSKPHKKIVDFLSDLGIEIVSNTKEIIAPYELDIYLPQHNLAIEINGLIWHSTQKQELVGNFKLKHRRKYLLSKEKDIKLLQFTDLEINSKWEIVSSIIRDKLATPSYKTHARKCLIKIPSKHEVKSFLEENHIQGFVGSRIELGLYHNNELVQLMTFGKSRMNKSYQWELLRLCSKLNTKVVGGSSRLFKFFIKAHLKDGEKIISYCDLSKFQGEVYRKLGFSYLRDSNPNYFYTTGKTLESRVSYQKHKLPKILDHFDPNLTEIQNMFNNGYRVIFDCGNGVWEF